MIAKILITLMASTGIFSHHTTTKIVTVKASNNPSYMQKIPDLYIGEKFQVTYKNNKIVKIQEVN